MAERAAAFLWSKQEADGGWHSATYGLLRSGQAVTPFVLHALLTASPSRPAGGVERALTFLRRGLDERGSLGRLDPQLLDYPNYATAYGLLCFVAAGQPVDRA